MYEERYGRIEHQSGGGGTLGKVVRVESPFVQKKQMNRKKKLRLIRKLPRLV